MPLQIDWRMDPETQTAVPKVQDMDYEKRAQAEVREVFQHVLQRGTDYPTQMKRGITTFWRTEVKQMDKTEFVLNTAAGLGIALAVGALITPAGWAFAATAGLTAIAGYAAGNAQEAINYRKGRKGVLKTMDSFKPPSKFQFEEHKFKINPNYSSMIRLTDWKVAKPMLKAMWKHFHDTPYVNGRYLGGDLRRAGENLEEIAALFAERKIKSQRKLNDRAATTRNLFRSRKQFDWGLKLKKLSYHAAWLHEFTRGWVEVVNGLYEEYNHVTDEILKSVTYQFHLAGNHPHCQNCACKAEFDQLARLSRPHSNITLSRRMQRDLGLKTGQVGNVQMNPLTNPQSVSPHFQGDVLQGYGQKFGHAKRGQQGATTSVDYANKGVAFVSAWSIGDACAETQAGNWITATMGSFGQAGGGAVSGAAGGAAGAGIGKLFGWVGRLCTVKIPVKGRMAAVFEAWASGEAFDPTDMLRKGAYSEEYMEHVISKLEHYQKKYDDIVKKFKTDLEKLSQTPDGRFPFHSCDHARDLLGKHAALFLQLAKFHIHVEYLNIFNHAVQTATDDLVFQLEKRPELQGLREVRAWKSTFFSIDFWYRYYNSIFGEWNPYTKEF